LQINRFFCENLSQATAELTSSEAHHLINVMRLNLGDSVELFDGKGTLATAKITSISKRKVTLNIEHLEKAPPTQTAQVVIATSIAKGERFDWLIAKCTELGVDRITPVIFERTVKLGKNPKIIDRWHNIAISSAKQCKRLFLPVIDKPTPLEQTLALIKADYPEAVFLLGSLEPDATSILTELSSPNDTIALIGPEGGLTENETDLLKKTNAKSVYLTETTLRVETAAITFAAILAAKRNVK